MNVIVKGCLNFLIQDPTWELDFALYRTRVSLGNNMTQLRYVNILEKIILEGQDIFYNRVITETTISTL